MRRVLLAIAIAAGLCDAQAPVAVLNNYSPTIKGLTVGTNRCIIWQLAAPWKLEVACYSAGVTKLIQVATADATLIGSFVIADGSGVIGWLVKPTGAASICFQSACGAACGGASALPNSQLFEWTFPASP